MTNFPRFLAVLAVLGLLVPGTALVTTSCSSAPKSGEEEMEGIADLSYTIFATTEHAIPATGTFGWGPRFFKVEYVPGTNLAEVDERLRSSVRLALESRGYRFAEENPELLVGYGLALNAPIDESALNSMYGEEFQFKFQTPEESASRTYHQGTLVLDFVDAGTTVLLWRGIAQGGVDLEVSTEAKDQRARQLAQQLVARFPDPSAVN